jgi:uncharacterized protein (DUF1501 family)
VCHVSTDTNTLSSPATTINYPTKKTRSQGRRVPGAWVYDAIHGGYDSHAVQLPTLGSSAVVLSDAIRAFLDDRAAPKWADRMLLAAFREFGRRPAENGSLGTDHGAAGPVLLS